MKTLEKLLGLYVVWWEWEPGTSNCCLRRRRTILSFLLENKAIDCLKGLGFERVYWRAKEHWAAVICSHTRPKVSYLLLTESWALPMAVFTCFVSLDYLWQCYVLLCKPCTWVGTWVFEWPGRFLSCGIYTWHSVYLLLVVCQSSPSSYEIFFLMTGSSYFLTFLGVCCCVSQGRHHGLQRLPLDHFTLDYLSSDVLNAVFCL